MNTLRFFFPFFVLTLMIAALSEGDHRVINGHTFDDVHTWSESKCIICHISDKPDADSHTLIDEDISRLCESCHKGTVSILPASTLRSSIDVMNNHPIKYSLLNFDSKLINHNIIKEGDNYYVSSRDGRLPLFGESRTSAVAECTTCHDPHGKAKKPKLHYIDNSNSQLCTICHLGKVP